MIPGRALVWLMVVPLVLGVLTVFDRSLLQPMLGADLAIAVVAAIDAWLVRKPALAIRRETPHVFSLARPNRVRLLVRSTARRKLNVRVNEDLFAEASSGDLPLSVELPARGSASTQYHVEPRRRGAYELGDHWARYSSPLGLWQRQVRIPASDTVRVYPDVHAIRAFELLARQDREYAFVRATRLQGGESEFERLREYTKDDEYRSIDWKATARRQKLIARQYQLERNQNLFFMLDAGRLMTAETAGLSQFDHALNAMLMLAHVAARGGDRVGMLAFDEGMRRFVAPAGGPSATRRLIQSSYDLHPSLVEADYDRAFEQMALRVRKRSLVVLFTQINDDAVAKLVVQRTRALQGRHLTLLVLFRDVEVDALLETESKSAADLYTLGAAAELVRWREGLIRELRRAGALVLDVHPRELTASLVNRYLEIKARHLL
jgi:uncharacterized protein (DUF58 family)